MGFGEVELVTKAHAELPFLCVVVVVVVGVGTAQPRDGFTLLDRGTLNMCFQNLPTECRE